MHSSRIRTVRCSARRGGVWPGVSAWEGVCLEGVCLGEGVCRGGVCPSACWDTSPCEQNDRCLWKHNLSATALRTVITLKEDAKCFAQSNLMFCSGYVLKSDLYGNYRSVSLASFCSFQNYSQYHIIGVVTISGQELNFSLPFTVVCFILLHLKKFKTLVVSQAL